MYEFVYSWCNSLFKLSDLWLPTTLKYVHFHLLTSLIADFFLFLVWVSQYLDSTVTVMFITLDYQIFHEMFQEYFSSCQFLKKKQKREKSHYFQLSVKRKF